MDSAERRTLAKECLDNGAIHNTKRHMTALAQAKLEFVREVLLKALAYRCKVFASIVSPAFEIDDQPDFLRKDFVYLLERYYYFLDDRSDSPSGIIVFDETEKNQSHLLIAQIENYFKKSHNGRMRSSLVIPEPFFVHSDLTTGIQIADIIAYLISWGMRFGNMSEGRRDELDPFIELIKPMRYRTLREIDQIKDHEIWSVVFVK